ncbi:DAR GTPase 2, mitochondrial isoform X3 [Gossypium australe]|uniref:DAR GTPase 2, mitochondrial isoform X3 n=1 Tax=Gossypium australe TaxID=47621 RepID=A0A5B6VR45_9ROSI|nr:DAR GTPase 2, mitochondrial isoform X3 [Gossypium australe]
MATSSTPSRITRKIGIAVKKAASRNKGWYDLHMATASGAIAQRLPLVDLVAEIRDARIPLSSEYELLRDFPALSKRFVVMNKIDLADQTQVKLLNFIQAQVRGLCKANHHASETITIMLVGIPNVGKSALANSLHQMGRISAAEKGRLKHATVSPQPGETKDISSFKIGSHPNIYLLDTPGILPRMIHDAELCSKLVLTGAIRDGLIEQKELARYFLTILNLSDRYKKWAKFSAHEDRLLSFIEHKEGSISSKLEMRQKKQHMMDHTQDLIVNNVRGTIFDTISCFDGNIELEEDMIKLMEAELVALREAFRVPQGLGEYVYNRVVGVKLLDLYRTGRLGHYTLDALPLTLHHPL